MANLPRLNDWARSRHVNRGRITGGHGLRRAIDCRCGARHYGDAQAEANIFQHFQEHTKTKMAILISHRFSTVRLAHEIVVMEHGQIKERGTHKALLAQQGQYAHLFTLQAEGYK